MSPGGSEGALLTAGASAPPAHDFEIHFRLRRTLCEVSL